MSSPLLSGGLILALTDASDSIIILIREALELRLLCHRVRHTLLRRLHGPLVSEHLVEVARVPLRGDLRLEGRLDLACTQICPVNVTEEGVRLDITRVIASSAQSSALIARKEAREQ